MQSPHLRISFIVPGNNFTGGIRSTVDLSNALLARGYDVRICCKKPHGIKARLRKLLKKSNSVVGGWVDQFQGKVIYFKNIRHISFMQEELVIAIGTMTVDYLDRINENVVRVKYCRGLGDYHPGINLYSTWGDDTPTIAVSHTLVPELQKIGAKNVIGVVPNGLRQDIYYNQDKDGRDGIGAIYSYSPVKCPEVLEKVLLRLNQQFSDVPQYVFGTKSKPRKLRHVNYYRLPSPEKARWIYNKAKIWLITSKSEGFCRPILEAMACGTAVISTENLGGKGLIKNNKNGILVPIGGVNSFMIEIEKLLNNEKLRQSIVQNGYKTAKKFTWDKSAEAMEAVLAKLIGKRNVE